MTPNEREILRGWNNLPARRNLVRFVLVGRTPDPEVLGLYQAPGCSAATRSAAGEKGQRELGPAAADKVSCGELLDDLLEHARHNVKASTERIWKLVVEASLRPYFGHRKAASLSTAILKEYRRKRLAEGRSEATCNRELSMLRTAFHLGRKCTPSKVGIVPYFPMVAEMQKRSREIAGKGRLEE